MNTFPPSSSTVSSPSPLIDLFLLTELDSLARLTSDVCRQMDHLLTVLNGTDIDSCSFISSLRALMARCDGSMVSFVSNCTTALTHLRSSTAARIDLRLVRHRKQLLDLLRLERTRRKDTHLAVHVSCLSSLGRR